MKTRLLHIFQFCVQVAKEPNQEEQHVLLVFLPVAKLFLFLIGKGIVKNNVNGRCPKNFSLENVAVQKDNVNFVRITFQNFLSEVHE